MEVEVNRFNDVLNSQTKCTRCSKFNFLLSSGGWKRLLHFDIEKQKYSFPDGEMKMFLFFYNKSHVKGGQHWVAVNKLPTGNRSIIPTQNFSHYSIFFILLKACSFRNDTLTPTTNTKHFLNDFSEIEIRGLLFASSRKFSFISSTEWKREVVNWV